MPTCLDAFLQWRPRRWLTAVSAAVLTFVVIGIPTDIIANPVFGRGVAQSDWALEVLIVTSILSGLLFATYVRNEPASALQFDAGDRQSTVGYFGTFLSLFAVGCPTCNKLVLIALGSSGAVTWFAPLQPYLAAASVLLLMYSLRTRIMRESSCRIPVRIQ